MSEPDSVSLQPSLNSSGQNGKQTPPNGNSSETNGNGNTNPNNTSNGRLIKNIKLISVAFKEAALDSPSFRASSNHEDAQVDNIEAWLEAIIRSLRKFPSHVRDFKEISDSFLEHLTPAFLQDGLIDQDYTVKALHTTVNGLRTSWSDSLRTISINEVMAGNLVEIIRVHIKRYRELRHIFELVQAKYDKYLAIFTSTPKTIDPSSLREDAFQLLETRKQYIHASLDLVVELAKLGRRLDSTLIQLTGSLWSSRPALAENERITHEKRDIQRIVAWSEAYHSSVKLLEKDMDTARIQIEESAIAQVTPSGDLKDHNPATINATVLSETIEKSNEKHGYLFMKTLVNKKTVWVKRWAFIKSGVLGLLVLSPSKKSVQETDKIGLLLCNTRYAPDEDRRFCFEVKTIDTTIVFQTETLMELKSWLKVFNNEKTRVLNIESSVSEGEDITALGRYPPLLYEFASTSKTSSDMQLTSDRVNNTKSVMVSSHLSSFIESNKDSFEREIYNKVPQVFAPMITASTKTAIISNAFVSPTIIPSALTANFWGSVNWGLYYLVDRTQAEKLGDNVAEHIRGDLKVNQSSSSTASLASLPKSWSVEPRTPKDIYPSYYPDNMKAFDIQMKAIFETSVVKDEFCLFSMRSIFSPNSKQELSGRTFLTNEHIFFYMNSAGFVSLVKQPLSILVSVENYQEKNYDVLKIYDLNGSMKVKLFLDDGKLARDKLNALIQNKVRDRPKSLKDLIEELMQIERDHQEKEIAAYHKKDMLVKEGEGARSDLTAIPSVVVTKEGPITKEMKIDFSGDMNLILEKSYDLPPKALFHMLVGDKSNLLQIFSVILNVAALIPSLWAETNEGKSLVRTFNLPVSFRGKPLGKLTTTQTVETMVDNMYYCIHQKRGSYHFALCSSFNIENRVVIYSTDNRRSKILVYSKIDFENGKKSPANEVSRAFSRFLEHYEMTKMDHEILNAIERIGIHGTVVKSIKLFGQLSKYDPEHGPPPPVEQVDSITTTPILFLRFFFDLVVIKMVHLIVKTVMTVSNGVVRFANGIRMNQVLSLCLIISLLYNLLLTGKTGTSYWNVQRAIKVVDNFRFAEPEMIQRAIYMKEVQDHLISGSTLSYNSSQSQCYQSFKQDSFILNYERTTKNDKLYGFEMNREIARKLRDSFQEVGVKRNELMIQLRILSKIEEELAAGEWTNWLLQESARCRYVRDHIVDNDSDEHDERVEVKAARDVLGYCETCDREVAYNSLL